MTAPFYARDEWVSDGTTALHTITWKYLSQLHLQVTVDDVAYGGTVTWTNDTQVTIDPVPSASANVAFIRKTPASVAGTGVAVTNNQLLYNNQ